jgi:hypothetical protein
MPVAGAVCGAASDGGNARKTFHISPGAVSLFCVEKSTQSGIGRRQLNLDAMTFFK